MPAANLEERLATICEHELLTPATHDFLVSVLAVLTEARQALEPFAGMAKDYEKFNGGKVVPVAVAIVELRRAKAVLAKFSASPVLPINQGPPASAPPQEEHVLVPKVPTKEMRSHFRELGDSFEYRYRAMLASVPREKTEPPHP